MDPLTIWMTTGRQSNFLPPQYIYGFDSRNNWYITVTDDPRQGIIYFMGRDGKSYVVARGKVQVVAFPDGRQAYRIADGSLLPVDCPRADVQKPPVFYFARDYILPNAFGA